MSRRRSGLSFLEPSCGMHILHLASWYPNGVHPQLGNFVQRHINVLPKGLTNRVLHVCSGRPVPQREGEDVHWVLSSETVRQEVEYVLDLPPRHIRIKRSYMRHYKQMKCEGYRPDVVHLHVAADAAEPAVKMAEGWGVPLVVSENWTAYHAEHGRSFRPREERGVRLALGHAQAHLPVSEHLGRAMARYAPGVRQVVVPNVVDAVFTPPAAPRSLEGPLRLLHVSSLIDDHKDITGMIRALAGAVSAGVDAVLDCWGGAGAGGAEVPRYVALAAELGLSDRVRFRGAASPPQVATAMGEADAFVLFSRYENLPCVLLEAWMTGLPTLATDVGGVGEHLGCVPGLGVLLQPGDEEGLTQAIVGLSEVKVGGQMPDSAAIHAYASARFTPEAVGGAIEAVYRSLV